ncbi:MAG TPA: zinc-binding dehydrogenase [Polyangiaceae bacterium]|nr:zinc-binding dehydrogenase [Polyangiaceae bacterium]
METYRAILLTGRGGPEVLETVRLPLREPGALEVRLSVRATGAGGTDVTMRRGRYAFAPPYPFVPGYEVVGDVEAVGAGVTDLAAGDRVAALVVHGGYAERIVIPAAAAVKVPEHLDDGEAVALILNYVTAYQAIHRSAKVRAGQTALVTGASGGVGTALIELLRLAGVRTVGAASPARHAVVRELGATPVDSRGGRIDTEVRKLVPDGVDVAFDTLGGAFVTQCVRATRRSGAVIGIGFSGTMKNGVPRRLGVLHTLMSVFVGARLRGRRGTFYGITYSYRKDPGPFRRDLGTLFSLLGERKIAPRIAARLPLLAAREAAEMLEQGGVEGKLVHLAKS